MAGVSTLTEQAERHKTRLKGFMIAGLGVLLLSPDALLVKSTSVTPVTFLFWRGLLLALAFAVINGIRYRSRLIPEMRACGRRGLYCGLAFAGSTLGFVTGMKNTAAGNVLVILNTAPVIAAVLAWVIWRERLPLRTWILILVCISGATLMAVGEMGKGQPLGLVMAGVAAFSLASNLAVARSRPHADMSLMLIFGALLICIVAAFFGGAQWPGWRDFGLIVLLCVGFLPAASILIQTGPRYIPAAEVSLFLLLETVLGTLLVWFFLGELPGPLAFAGGAIILTALAINGFVEDRRQRRQAREALAEQT